jgi:tripartite-type tricarboxylate transporter receptor subunit TctC
MSKLPYDPLTDLKPVTRLFFIDEALVVSDQTPAQSVGELRALMKDKPGKLSYGTLQAPGTDYFQAGLYDQWGARMVAVPFKGGGEVLTALLANQVQIGYAGAGNFAEQVKAGKLRMLAINADARVPQFPDVPTFAEAGIKPFKIKAWWGMFAPKGTPDDLVARVNTELQRTLAEPKMKQFLSDQFMDEALTETPAQFQGFVKQDYDRGAALVKEIKQSASNQ